MFQLDSDIRTPSLKWWNNSKNIENSFKVIGYDQELISRQESSIRSYLRFSLLTERNRQRLTKYSIGARTWLEGGCPIAFEIVIGLVYKETIDDNPLKTEKVANGLNCGFTLGNPPRKRLHL